MVDIFGFSCQDCGATQTRLTQDPQSKRMICEDTDLCKETRDYEKLMKQVDFRDKRG